MEFIGVAVTVAVNQVSVGGSSGRIVFRIVEASAGFEPAVEVLHLPGVHQRSSQVLMY